MNFTATEHNIGSTKGARESIAYARQNRCANAARSLDALSHCLTMPLIEFPTLIIRWCRVRLSGGPPIKPLCHKGSSSSASGKKRKPLRSKHLSGFFV